MTIGPERKWKLTVYGALLALALPLALAAPGCSDDDSSGCPDTMATCDGECTDTDNNPDHCGGCDSPCGAGEFCVAGACSESCPAPFEDCSGTCTDTRYDPAHCGGCDQPCDSGANANASCADGTCGLLCVAGYADCDIDATNGCETDTNTDVNHCGDCSPCTNPHGTTSCTAGACAPVCDAGFGDCDSDPKNGCELNTAMDPSNCGGCGIVCGPTEPYCIDAVCNNSAPSCAGVLANDPTATSGIYSLSSMDATGYFTYGVYCDMVTEGGGWTRIIGTDGNDQDFGQNTPAIVTSYVTADATVGVADAFRYLQNYSQILLVKTSGDASTGEWAAYDLVSSVSGRSILDIIVEDCAPAPVVYQNDTVHDGSRMEGGWTSVYSGTQYDGSLLIIGESDAYVPPAYFFMCGVNESSDNDQSVLAFCDLDGENNYWFDGWRGTSQEGTVWSFWNNDYFSDSNSSYHIGNDSYDANAGYKGDGLAGTTHAGTYEIYLR